MGATPWGAIAQTVGGLFKAGVGLSQIKQGKKLVKAAGDQPLQQMPDEVNQNVTDAGIDAATGMPSEQYNRAMQNIQRNQLWAMRNAGSRRGGLMALPQLLAGSNDAMGDVDVASANMRLANRRYLYGAREKVAGWKDKLYTTNQLNPWLNKINYAQGLLGQGNQTLSSAFGDTAAGAIGIASAYGKKPGG